MMAVDPGIQMNQKELTKTFMMISNWIKPFGLYGLYSALRVDYKDANTQQKYTALL